MTEENDWTPYSGPPLTHCVFCGLLLAQGERDAHQDCEDRECARQAAIDDWKAGEA